GLPTYCGPGWPVVKPNQLDEKPPRSRGGVVTSKVNPLSCQVDALRSLLLGTHVHLALDYGVLALAAALGILSASSLLGRLAR
ncbi:hypothetical protein ACFY2I_54655, partial [Streptomyces mirabilis]